MNLELKPHDSEKPTRSYVASTLAGPPTPPRPPIRDVAELDELDEAPQDELPPGTEVMGRYRLEETVGCGGMASVYRGRHVDIGNTVALKVMHAKVASMPGAAARFLTEARAVAAVQHPGVVRVSDFGELDCGRPFMVMEHLAGCDLDTRICDRGPLSWAALKPILVQVCDALQVAHEAGIVHRDVKPANIFLRSDAPEGLDVKVLDFGIAKVTDEMIRAEDDPQTQTLGLLVGTPDYMAPEQGRYGEIDHRADIYALGATAFTCLAGEPPFPSGGHPIEQIAKHMYETPPTLADCGVEVPAGVQSLISRAMAKDPEARFQTMAEFRAAVEAVGTEPREVEVLASCDESAPERRPLRRYGLATAAIALVVAGMGVTLRGTPVSQVAASTATLQAAIPTELPQREFVREVEVAPEPEPVQVVVPEEVEVEPPQTEPAKAEEATPVVRKRHRSRAPEVPEPEPEPIPKLSPKPEVPAEPWAEAPTEPAHPEEVGAIKNPYD